MAARAPLADPPRRKADNAGAWRTEETSLTPYSFPYSPRVTTSSPAGDLRPRAAKAAAVVLGAAVLVGAIGLGAPPRFAGSGGPQWLRDALASLLPLTVVEAGVAAALGLVVGGECLRRESPALPGGPAARRALLPLVLLLALGLLQLVPLPGPVLEVAAPHSARTYAALTATGEEAMRPASLWPEGTAHALYNLAGAIAASALVWTLVRGPHARRAATALLVAVAAFAAFESAAGLASTKLGDDRLLGAFEKVSGKGRVTGTFVHGTMLAVWAGMGACAALGLAAAWGRGARALVAALAVPLCVVAGFLSLSRLGWAAIVAGLLAALAFAALPRTAGRGRAALLGAGALVLVAGALAVAFAVPAFRQRVEYFVTAGEPRLPAWESTWALFLEAPVAGTGLGSFGRSIHLEQSPDCPQELWFAHSDPLNLLSDAGVLGAALALWWLAVTVRRGIPALRSADAPTRCLAAGALGGAIVVLLASLADFQTQFPVVAIPFAALLTVPAALSASESAPPREDARPWLLPTRALVGLVAIAAGAAVASPVLACGARIQDLREAGVTGATPAETLVARARAALATCRDAADPAAEIARAEALLAEAARRDPLLDDAHLWTALARLALGRPRDDVLRALGRARLVARGRARTNFEAGRIYLDLLGEEPAPYGPPGDGAAAALREAGAIEPWAFSAAWAAVIERGGDLATLRAITPARGHAVVVLADHLRSLGRDADAVEVLAEQLRRDPGDAAVASRLAAAYVAVGREDEGRARFRDLRAVWPETP